MTLEEYKKKFNQLEQELSIKKKELGRKFIIANKKYKKGEVIRDIVGHIKIEKFGGFYEADGSLSIFYLGPKLKSDGSQYRTIKTRRVFESNIIEDEQ